MDIATKISIFINAKAHKTIGTLYMKTKEILLLSDTIRSNRWSTREFIGARNQQKGNMIFISEITHITQNESLATSVIGTLPKEILGVT